MVALYGASRFKPVPCSQQGTLLPMDGTAQTSNPSAPDINDMPVWTGESGAVSALDAIQMARAAGGKLANTGIR